MLRLGILAVAVLLISTAQGKPSVSNLIEPVNYFSGRSVELERLNVHLLEYKTSSIVGLTGIGKSQLIRKYAFENKEKYNLIWFFDCSLSLDRQFSNLARAINAKHNKTQISLPEDVNAKQAILNYISSNKDVLIVLDNIKIGNNDIIQDFSKLEHNGHIAFCSQDSNNLPHVIRLSNLSQIDSNILLNKIIDKRSFQEKEILNNLLKGYPLLITQAAFLLKDNKFLTVNDYKMIFREQKRNIENHIDIVLLNLSRPAEELLYKLALIGDSFSRDCVNRINVDTNPDSLQELIRFGLISDAGMINSIQLFEMHNVIKSTLLNNQKQANIISSMMEVIKLMHNSLPERSLNRYKLFLTDNTILNAIEQLEQNAILHKVHFLNVLILTRHRLVFSLFSRDDRALNSIDEWFRSYNDKVDINKVQNTLQKISYSECIFVLGLNDFIFKQNVEKGYEQIKIAQKIIEHLPGQQHFKSNIYGQLAQYYVDIGDLKNAEESLQKMLLLKTKYPEIELSPRLYYLVNSKIYLNNGQYEFALKEIEYCLGIEENKIILNNTFLYGTYLLQARILNRMKNYNKAKEICLKIYKQSTFTKLDSDLIALTYIELSTAELGLNSINNDAFNYAEQAYKLLKNNKIRNNDILHSRDTYLADAIVAKSNALSSVGKPQQAIEGYLVAEVIYYNKYKNNMKNIDDISYMYYNAALAGKNMKTNSIWFTQFHNKHLKYFGQNHQRSKELD
ncbi:MAG: hypothetical protein K2P53_00770 [Rickettsiales bacterium]|nr:hypothetical protein [Rickettsiales bacterium]